jgi:inosine/xanthosine triphosphatase
VRVHVGTSNPLKVRAVRAAFGRRATVVAVKAVGDAPPQPVSLGQIVRGATTRAERARDACPERGRRADFGVGIEAGVFRLGGTYYNITVAVVTDGKRSSLGGSPFFAIPARFVHAIARGEDELGRHFAGRGAGAVGAATGGRVKRAEATRLAVEMALAPWRSPELYS